MIRYTLTRQWKRLVTKLKLESAVGVDNAPASDPVVEVACVSVEDIRITAISCCHCFNRESPTGHP